MKQRILIVDDQPYVRCSLADYFTRLGARVDAAESAEAADALLRRHGYAVVIADLSLSDGAGREGLELLARVGGRPGGPRTVLISGYGTPEVEVESAERGIDAFFPKMRPLSELARVVADLLHDLPGPGSENRAGGALPSLTADDYRRLVENAFELVTLVDPRGVIRFQNAASAEILGLPPSALVGSVAAGRVHPDDREVFDDLLDQCSRRPGQRFVAEYRLRARDGSWRTLRVRGASLGSCRRLRAVVVHGLDVTWLRRAEQQLRDERGRQHAVRRPTIVRVELPDDEGDGAGKAPSG